MIRRTWLSSSARLHRRRRCRPAETTASATAAASTASTADGWCDRHPLSGYGRPGVARARTARHHSADNSVSDCYCGVQQPDWHKDVGANDYEIAGADEGHSARKVVCLHSVATERATPASLAPCVGTPKCPTTCRGCQIDTRSLQQLQQISLFFYAPHLNWEVIASLEHLSRHKTEG